MFDDRWGVSTSSAEFGAAGAEEVEESRHALTHGKWVCSASASQLKEHG